MKINHVGTKEIKTERLILRKFNENDAKEIFETWLSDSEVAKYMVWNHQKDIKEAEEWLKKCISKYEKLDVYNWGIELKENGKLVGSISANKTRKEILEKRICYRVFKSSSRVLNKRSRNK